MIDTTCKHGKPEIDCEWCTLSVAWAVVKDSREMKRLGHASVVQWARAVIDLKDQKRVVATRHPHSPDGQPRE
jgi:hypothetical protein